ncbi:LacI family DNA-binding transcriptional regulator [Apirhabdus apintestini]|nr:LacI family DNA-binding transcriptional regulator [Enterobacteriaceae bacterium CA-0114]
MKNSATISDVARAAKTGKTSVSRYLNGEQHRLSDALRLRIEQAIRGLNYRPNQMARGLKRGRTRLIGVIIADITNPYSIEILGGIESTCREHGYTLLVCNANNETELEAHYLKLLYSYQVEGIIINAVGIREFSFGQHPHPTIPTVLIDRKITGQALDMVGLDNHQATQLCVQHLLHQGFQALLFLSEPVACVNTRRERQHVFHTLLQKHPDIAAESRQIALTAPSGELDALINTFQHRYKKSPCAIVSANGAIALHIARALKRLSLVPGKDIGLLSFDELPWADLVSPGITTLQQPTTLIGQAALKRLILRIQGSADAPADKLFPGRLNFRGSTQISN